jgi:DNA modification methylase
METNCLYIGKAENVLKKIPSNSIDLIITSPPYDELRDYENQVIWNFDVFMGIAKELYRVIKPAGYLVWVVADMTKNGTESLTSMEQALYFKKECKFLVHDTMIYEKTGFSNPSNNRYHQVWEYMFVFVKPGKPKTFNPLKDRINKYAGKTRWGKNTSRQVDGTLKVKSDTAPTAEYGMRFNVWKISAGGNVSTSDKIAFEHPAIFPEQLAKDHILSWTNEGDIILDPMCGSGTTLKMAHLHNRKWIGIDCVEKYINEITAERLKLHNIEFKIVKND